MILSPRTRSCDKCLFFSIFLRFAELELIEAIGEEEDDIACGCVLGQDGAV
jgi:hypothetical protein